jgi:hypothetical protein
MNQTNESDSKKTDWGIRACIAAAVLSVVAGLIVGATGFRTPRSGTDYLNDLGNWGSYLQGTTASLWSLAGVFLIVTTFLAQRRQLKEQARQFKIQNDSIKRQNFETAFFQLLNLHNQIVTAIRDVDTKKSYYTEEVPARDSFKTWYESFKNGLWGVRMEEDERGKTTVKSAPKTLTERYLAFYGAYQGILGHYFRNLYHVFKFVDRSEIEDKRRYTSLARAQLSQYELALLFYNALTAIPPETENKFKPLIEEYGLLENLNRELLLMPEDEKLYDSKAFK